MKRVAITLLALVCTGALSSAERIEIRRDTVLEATSDQDLNIARAREGDRFTVTLRASREVPAGTQLEGEVLRVEPKRGDQPGYVDLQFDEMRVPGDRPLRINALPISLDDKKIRRDRDGRLVADSRKHKSEHYVFGGLLGGLLVGSLVKKPFEGAFAGTLAGIIFSEIERDRAKKSGDSVLKRGSKLGVLFTEDVAFQSDDRDRDRDRDERDRDRDRRGQAEYEGRAIDLEMIRSGGSTLVAVNDLRQFGIDVDESGDRLYLEQGDTWMRLTVGSSDYRLARRGAGELPAEVRRIDGRIYVPAEALAAVLPGTLKVDGMIVKRPA